MRLMRLMRLPESKPASDVEKVEAAQDPRKDHVNHLSKSGCVIFDEGNSSDDFNSVNQIPSGND